MIKPAPELIKEAQELINCIDATKARELLMKNPEATLIDVREKETHDNSSITNSLNIPRGVLEFKVAKACPNPESLILTHCQGGGRASLAALTLKRMGYDNVYAITESFDTIKQMLDATK